MALEVGGGSNPRRILSDDGRDAWAGLTLGAVLGTDTRSASVVQVSRTLLDIIRDEEPNSGAYKNLISHNNNKKNWKSFKDLLLLRKAGDAWTSSVHSPSSEPAAVQQNSRSLLSWRNSIRIPATVVPGSGEAATEDRSEQVVCDLSSHACQPQVSRRLSTHIPSLTSESNQSPVRYNSNETMVVETVPVSYVPSQTLRSQMLRHNLSRLPSFSNHSTQSDSFNEHSETAAPSIRLSAALAAEREQIQRVVSSTEAGTNNNNEVDATVTTEEEDETETAQQPVRMSLMDLLEETDRQMGWTSYSAGNVEDEEEVVKHDDEHNNGGGGGGGGREHNCCVCMVRHKGAAFIPCGHTFCRLCSRELWVNRGNCPLCNGYILEILDIF